MTTTLQPADVPACPPWCTNEHSNGWDQVHSFAGTIRETIKVCELNVTVLVEDGEVDIRVHRYACWLDSDGLRVDQPDICLEGTWLTKAEAQRVVQTLTEAVATI